MHFLTLLAASGLASAAVIERATAPAKQEYYLKTHVKSGQAAAKSKYNNLYLEAYHTGAGLNDATFAATTSNAAKGYLANPEQVNSSTFYNQLFDLGSEFPWEMVVDYTQVQYTSWQPIRINAGSGGNDTEVTGFYSSAKEGLKWTSTPATPGKEGIDAFAGWIVCDWWHGVPELFMRTYQQKTALPSSCADVDLEMENVATGY